jgi:2,5-diketo-D-gluconate reductase B
MTKSPYFSSPFERGFGTWPLRGERLRAAVHGAIDVGYRAFDTAQMYGNEEELGAALADSGASLEEFLITTKVHPDNVAADRLIPSLSESLRRLRVECVDVALLHWPPANGDVAQAVRWLEEAVREGLARAIGVSNFTAAMMREAASAIGTPLVANQVEFHPLIDQTKLLAAAAQTGIPLVAYCSLARGAIDRYPLFAELGEQYGRSPAQIALRWILQKGVAITTMSTRSENMRANFDVMNFTLSSVDMARIDALQGTGLRIVNRDTVPWAPDWD